MVLEGIGLLGFQGLGLLGFKALGLLGFEGLVLFKFFWSFKALEFPNLVRFSSLEIFAAHRGIDDPRPAGDEDGLGLWGFYCD